MRLVTSLLVCVVAVQWLQASARYIGHVSSPFAEFGKNDDQLVPVVSDDESLLDRRPARRLPVGTYDGLDEDYDDDDSAYDQSSTARQQRASISSKRSAWAPSEVRVDQLLQKLRSHLYQNRYKHSSPSPAASARWRRSGSPATSLTVTDADQLRQLLRATPSASRHHQPVIDDLEANIAILDFLRSSAERPKIKEDITLLRSAAVRPEVRDESDGGEHRPAEWNEIEEIEAGNGADKRATIVGAAEIRSPRDIHPVYLGMGQSAASAALNTYASLLADDKRRESSDHHISSNPVRFIGKR